MTYTDSELTKILNKAGFYYRRDHATKIILVGPNRHGKLPDMEFFNNKEVASYIVGWKHCLKQFNIEAK